MARLDLLAIVSEHILNGVLGHKHFDFAHVNASVGDKCKTTCGTHGCAMGELPIIFPDQWEFGGPEGVRLIENAGGGFRYDVCSFFEITGPEMDHLFYPDQQDPSRFGGSRLSDWATRDQVADNIDEFIELKKAA